MSAEAQIPVPRTVIDNALCRGRGATDDAYPEDRATVAGRQQLYDRFIARYCSECPVQPECLAYALEAGEPYGVWGGTSPEDRDALRADLDMPPVAMKWETTEADLGQLVLPLPFPSNERPGFERGTYKTRGDNDDGWEEPSLFDLLAIAEAERLADDDTAA